MKAAIFGAGSLGTIMGAYLTKGGVPIELVTRNKAHVDALNQHGATVTGTVNMNVPVTALTPDQMQGPYDAIFLMTKQLDNEATVHDLEPLLAPDGVICTLQNGLPEMLISSIVGPERTMGCTVAWGATMTALGVSELTSEPDALSFGLGVFPPVPERRAHEVQQLLETMCPVELEPNFIGARYSKLLINASFSGMSAVLGSTFGEAANDKRSRVYVQRIIKECLDVADAAGIRVEPIQGHQRRQTTQLPRRAQADDLVRDHPHRHQEACPAAREHAAGPRAWQAHRGGRHQRLRLPPGRRVRRAHPRERRRRRAHPPDGAR